MQSRREWELGMVLRLGGAFVMFVVTRGSQAASGRMRSHQQSIETPSCQAECRYQCDVLHK